MISELAKNASRFIILVDILPRASKDLILWDTLR